MPAPDVLGAAAYAILYAVLIGLWPALPAQDAPAWVYEAAVLHEVGRGGAVAGCALVRALPPNAFSQLVIAGLMGAWSAERAGRVYVAGCVIALCAALVYLCRARDATARSRAVIAALPLCAGYPFYHGFLNYMAALPALGFGIGALLRNPECRGARGFALLTALPICLYTCHGTALGVWGLLLVVLCVVRRSWSLLLRAALSAIPVLVLVVLYAVQRHDEGASITWSAGSFAATALYRLRSPLRFFSLFHGLAPTYDDASLHAVAPMLVVLNVGYAIGLCVVGLRWALRARRSEAWDDRFVALGLLWLSACFVLLPHDVAKMLNPAERLLLPAALLGALGLAGAPGRSGVSRVRWLRAGLWSLLALQGLYALVWGSRAAGAAAELVRARGRYGFDAVVVQARQLRFAPPAPALGAVGLLPRHQVLAMQGMLAAWRAGRVVAPFDTGLFRCNLHQSDPSGWDLETFEARERPLVLLGERAQTQGVADQLAPAYREVEVGMGYCVLQRAAAPSQTPDGQSEARFE